MVSPGSKRGQMGIISWRRVGNAPLAPGVQVAQIISKPLKLIRSEVIVITQQVVVGWPCGSLQLKISN